MSVVGVDRIAQRAATNIGDLLNELPSFRPTQTRASGGLGTGLSGYFGGRVLDLRGLGASAAYGSDAVAGVVNFILDQRLNGIRSSLDYGESSRGDDRTSLASLAVGTDIWSSPTGSRWRVWAT